MIDDILFILKLAISFLPFLLFAFFNAKANVKKEVRYRQYLMPLIAVVYSTVLFLFLDQLSGLSLWLFMKLGDLFDFLSLPSVGDFIRDLYNSWGIYLLLVLFNTLALIVYVFIKKIITVILGKIEVRRNTFVSSVVELFYSYDENDEQWYIKNHYGQAKTFIKTIYYGSCIVSGLALLISCWLCMNRMISAPFYPAFAIIIIGEMAFFIDGVEGKEQHSELSVKTDKSRHVVMYPLLRNPLRRLFGDKLSAEGTTVNNEGSSGNAIEDVLVDLEKDGGHVGKNYALFIRKKMQHGLKPHVDYVRCGYDLANGKSLLFNTPFYDKLNPYVFYAMNRELLTGGKILIVLGRHGTEEDLKSWAENGMRAVSNIPDLWNISLLSGESADNEYSTDIGIISRSGVHDLNIHKNNMAFLRNVSFVVVVEPSRLVTTAQIGLNLLIKCCGAERPVTFCSVDRNCDGLVDSLSHILMTNITEVTATEYPRGISSFMYWTADSDYLQHRIVPGVSRFLGMGTEISMAALKNQVKKTVWYGGDTFPVLDAHWIAKQYYYDLLDYAQLPPNQETFDRCFLTSFNLCNERVNDYSFITVEDDRCNLFETRRNFATISEQQGFVNVISSEYMLREYMSENMNLFTADAKAIPYIAADYARTKRNSILLLCLLLSLHSVQEEALCRQMEMMNLDTTDPSGEIWREICHVFGDASSSEQDNHGYPILSVKTRNGEVVRFEKDRTILFKREYSVESGKFESIYTIDHPDFAGIILADLQNARYIAEQESKDLYIGTELKGHVYQKYLPGQFFTLNGKYYEMVSTTFDNRILVRRASEHIVGRLSYRQIRNYKIHRLEDSDSMGSLKTVNNIGIHYQFADFSVETPGYWKLQSYNDFDNGDLVNVNGVPDRTYRHKQILKFDFSKLGDAFTDSVRMTLTNLLNEVFVTLFADNQPFISAITPGNYDAPVTYSLSFEEACEGADKCIFIVEDSQLDIGLLVAVERNISRIFQIISDYLSWNEEKIAESIRAQEAAAQEEKPSFNAYEEDAPKKRKGFFGKIGAGIKSVFGKIGGFFRKLFGKKKKEETPEETSEGSDVPLTPKQQRKAERSAARAARKAKKQEQKRLKKLGKDESAEDLEASDLTQNPQEVPELAAADSESNEVIENPEEQADEPDPQPVLQETTDEEEQAPLDEGGSESELTDESENKTNREEEVTEHE